MTLGNKILGFTVMGAVAFTPAIHSEQYSLSSKLERQTRQVKLVLEKRLSSENQKYVDELSKEIVKLSRAYGFEPEFILSVIHVESSFRTHVVSKAGAIGLMQLLPTTASYVAKKYKISYRGKKDLTHPVKNVVLGVSYLFYLRKRFGHFDRFVAAYNLGPTTVGRMVGKNQFELGAVEFYVMRIRTQAQVFKRLSKQGTYLSMN